MLLLLLLLQLGTVVRTDSSVSPLVPPLYEFGQLSLGYCLLFLEPKIVSNNIKKLNTLNHDFILKIAIFVPLIYEMEFNEINEMILVKMAITTYVSQFDDILQHKSHSRGSFALFHNLFHLLEILIHSRL